MPNWSAFKKAIPTNLSKTAEIGNLLSDFSLILAGFSGSSAEGLAYLTAALAGKGLFTVKKLKNQLFADDSNELVELSPQKRFDLLFHLVCQEAYLSAIYDHFETYPQQIRDEAKLEEAIQGLEAGTLETTETSTDLNLNDLDTDLPLFQVYEKQVSILLKALGEPQSEYLKKAKQISQNARKNLQLIITEEKDNESKWLNNQFTINTLKQIDSALKRDNDEKSKPTAATPDPDNSKTPQSQNQLLEEIREKNQAPWEARTIDHHIRCIYGFSRAFTCSSYR